MISNESSTSLSKTYKVDEIAEILNIGRTAAYNLIKEGHFKSVRIGSAIRVSKLSFDKWLNDENILTSE
ncbi:MAG: helix-turn-helix domain-containing protein [Clostridia bacterium]